MINVNEYIKLVLSKKKWSNRRLCKEINRIEEKLGDSRTSYQNITNYLNGSHNMRPKWLVKVEKALNLEQGTLVNMVMPPDSKEGKKELKELMRKVRGIK